MLGDNNATRYLLLHLTNHASGRDLMKDCVWRVCPKGGYYARKADNPSQQYLITPEPDLAPLERWVLGRLRKRPHQWQELIAAIRWEIWREPHLNKIIRELRKRRMLDGDDYEGRFGPGSDPRLFIPKKRPKRKK